MTDVQTLTFDSLPDVRQQLGIAADAPLVGLMVGSKPNKLKLGVPLSLGIADHLAAAHPPIHCVIPVAPTLTLNALSCYANPHFNPELKHVEGTTATLVQSSAGLPYLETPRGTKIYLWQQLPNYPCCGR